MEIAVIGLVAVVLVLVAASLVSVRASAASDQRDADARRQNEARLHRLQGKPSPETIAANKDPRAAAAILLYQAAAFRGDLSDETDAALINGMQKLFNTDAETAETLFADAWRALGETNDPGVPLEALAAPILETCTDSERRQFLALLQRIATLGGAPNPQQLQHFESLRGILV